MSLSYPLIHNFFDNCSCILFLFIFFLTLLSEHSQFKRIYWISPVILLLKKKQMLTVQEFISWFGDIYPSHKQKEWSLIRLSEPFWKFIWYVWLGFLFIVMLEKIFSQSVNYFLRDAWTTLGIFCETWNNQIVSRDS